MAVAAHPAMPIAVMATPAQSVVAIKQPVYETTIRHER